MHSLTTAHKHLLVRDLSANERRQNTRTGELLRVRRGTYVPNDVWKTLNHEEQHLLRAIVVAADQRRSDCVLSHVSAALLHGLPAWNVPLKQIHLTRASRTGGGVKNRLVVHSASLDSGDFEVVDGIPVTRTARTVVDVARTVPFEQAVVIGDAALHREIVTKDELALSLERARNLKGIAAARRAVAFMDRRSESVGESRSRVLFHAQGVASPQLQAEVYDAEHTLIGRADFLFDEGLIGEFDGQVKYGRYLRPGETIADAVLREKRREDALRELGWLVIRWMWADLSRPTHLARRILEALSRARSSRRPSGIWIPA
ncbi:hypothetical protein [Hoyosella subflava]|nr:hypothetical protein [Hoyosella subflava]